MIMATITQRRVVTTMALLAGIRSSAGSHKSEEQLLMEEVFQNYDPVARPVLNASHSTTIEISFILMKLSGLSLKKETLVTSGYIRSTWLDERIHWEPADHGGIQVLLVSPLMVWLPDFVLFNRVGPMFFTMEHYTLFRVLIRHDGHCKWVPAGEFQSQCTADVRFFPFDTQRCTLVFGNWMYMSSLVNLTFRPCVMDEVLEAYSPNGEWDLSGVEVVRTETSYAQCCDCALEPFAEVHFTYTFVRKPLYYVMNIIVPSVILCVLVLAVLWLPPDSGEKMSMGVTLLLSFSVFLFMVSENVPKTSTGVPIVVIYLLTFMGITGITVALSVVVLLAHHSHVTTPPPPCLLRLAWILNKSAMVTLANWRRRHRLSVDDAPHQSGGAKQRVRLNGVRQLVVTDGSAAPREDSQTIGAEILHLTRRILGQLEAHRERIQSMDRRRAVALEWQAAATAIDRLGFCLISGLFLGGAIFILVVLPA